MFGLKIKLQHISAVIYPVMLLLSGLVMTICYFKLFDSHSKPAALICLDIEFFVFARLPPFLFQLLCPTYMHLFEALSPSTLC